MPVDVLRCRVCESEYPALANGICVRCFGPLEPVYDWDEVAELATRERIEAGPLSLWRYSALLPCTPPEDAASGPGLTPLVPAPRLAQALGVGEVLLKLDLANPTHSFKDRVVAIAAAKAREFGLETLSATSTGNLANAVAARAAATGMQAVIFCPPGSSPRSSRRPRCTAPRCTAFAGATTTARVSSASSRARWSGRSSTSTCARTTPRARRRSPSRSASSSAGRPPMPSSCRSAPARCSPRSGSGSSSSGVSG